MEFENPRAIYQQIADQMRDRILQGEFAEGQRIPSIREFAVSTGVNPNTVTKSYQSLLDRGIIMNQRGLGYFVADDARQHILAELREALLGEELPRVFRTMQLLDLDEEQLAAEFKRFREKSKGDGS